MKMVSKNVRAGFRCVFFGRATSVFSFKRMRGKKETDQKNTCVKSVKIGLTLPNSRLMQQRLQNWAELHSKFSHGHADVCASICADPRS